MVYALDKTASVDFSLVAAPTVTSQLLDTNHKGGEGRGILFFSLFHTKKHVLLPQFHYN